MEAIEALALVSGHVEEELLIRNEYLAAERLWTNNQEKSIRNDPLFYVFQLILLFSTHGVFTAM